MNKIQSSFDLHNSCILNYSVAIKIFQSLLLLLVVVVFLVEVKFYGIGIYKLNFHLVDFLGDIPVT